MMKRLFLALLSFCTIQSVIAQPFQWKKQLMGHHHSISFLTVNEEAQLLLSGDAKGRVTLWSLENLEPQQQIEEQQGLITHIECDPDRQWLLIASYDGSILVWDYANERIIRRFENPAIPPYGQWKGNEPTFSLFVPDTDYVVFGGYNGQVLVGRISTGETRLLFQSEHGAVTTAAWSTNEEELYFSVLDEVYRLSEESGDIGLYCEGEQAFCEIYPTADAAFWAWTYGGKAQLWENGRLQKSLQASPVKGTSELLYIEAANLLVTGNAGVQVQVWDVEREQIRQSLDRHFAQVRCLAFSNADYALYTGDDLGIIHQWTLSGFELPTAAFSSNGGAGIAQTQATAPTEEQLRPTSGIDPTTSSIDIQDQLAINDLQDGGGDLNDGEASSTMDLAQTNFDDLPGPALTEQIQHPPANGENWPGATAAPPTRETIIDVQGTVSTDEEQLSLTIWDHDQMDHDTISLRLNGQWLLTNYPLSKQKQRLMIPLRQGVNLLTLYAHNVGRIPPNTAALGFEDRYGSYVTRLHSDMDTSGTIKIIKNSE